FWGNLAFTHARYVNFDFDGGSFSGNTPPNVAPVVANAGASYRYERWWWPIEIGASVRHVGNRYLWDDNAVVMDAYTVADAYLFVDIEKSLMLPNVDKTRLAFRVRNLTNRAYAAFSDPVIRTRSTSVRRVAMKSLFRSSSDSVAPAGLPWRVGAALRTPRSGIPALRGARPDAGCNPLRQLGRRQLIRPEPGSTAETDCL